MQAVFLTFLATATAANAEPAAALPFAGHSTVSDCLVLGDWATNHSTAAAQMHWTSLDLHSPLWCCQGGGAPGVQCDSAGRVANLTLTGKGIEGELAGFVAVWVVCLVLWLRVFCS